MPVNPAVLSGSAVFFLLALPFIILFAVYYNKANATSSAASCPACSTGTGTCPVCATCATPTAASLITRTYTAPQTGSDYPGNDTGGFSCPDAATCLLVASQQKGTTGALYWPLGSAPNATGLCYPKTTAASAKNPSPLTGIQAYWFTS